MGDLDGRTEYTAHATQYRFIAVHTQSAQVLHARFPRNKKIREEEEEKEEAFFFVGPPTIGLGGCISQSHITSFGEK